MTLPQQIESSRACMINLASKYGRDDVRVMRESMVLDELILEAMRDETYTV